MTTFLNKLASNLEPHVSQESLFALSGQGEATGSLEDRAMCRLQQREIHRQGNLERIISMAAAELQEEVADDAVEADWLAMFVDLAADAGDETAQQLWARILALQVAVPGAIFKRTLMQLHSMDLWELKAFIEYCSFAFAFESGWRFVFEESITRPELWGYSRGNDYTQHFINIGLLATDVSMLRVGVSRGIRIRYYENEYELVSEAAEGSLAYPETEFGYRRFTVTGQQLTKALRVQTYYGYARNVIARLAAEHKVEFRLVDDDKD